VSGRGDARQDHGRTLISLGHMPCYKGSTYWALINACKIMLGCTALYFILKLQPGLRFYKVVTEDCNYPARSNWKQNGCTENIPERKNIDILEQFHIYKAVKKTRYEKSIYQILMCCLIYSYIMIDYGLGGMLAPLLNSKVVNQTSQP
jgi:hypothetical protein